MYDKKAAAALSALVFILFAVFFTSSGGNADHRYMVKALLFLVGGAPLAAFGVGVPIALLHTEIARVLIGGNRSVIQRQTAGAIKAFGIVLLLVQIGVIFYLTKLVHERLIM